MKTKIEKVAVLGAGVMGAQIAAHLSNAGIPSYLFDISQDLAEKGIQVASRLKPPPFYNPRTASLITPCNYDEHIERLGGVDWVVEAVVERLDIKHGVFQRIEPHLKSTAIVSSNTSGLSIHKMMEPMSDAFQKRFLVTHFFNPPRYMRLLEIVAGGQTDEAVVQTIVQFSEEILGKGIVFAKDTPNFIANRIGTFGMMLTMKLTKEMNLAVEEVDKLTGTLVGRPKSASFRTADVVGLDTLAHVAKNTFEFCPDDEARDIFQVPDFLQKMLDKGWLGQKTKKGFYQKVGDEILSLDLGTLEFTPQKQVRFDGYRVAKDFSNSADRIRALAYSDDQAGKFFWELIAGTLIYTANRLPEIADDIINVDNGMKWGFGWELGPFETWDAIGLEKSVKRMRDEGKKVPAWINEILESGETRFYRRAQGEISHYDLGKKKHTVLKQKPKLVNLALAKDAGREIRKNWCAGIVDIGDGIACLEFHSVLQPTMNPIDASIIDMLEAALEVVPKQGFKGLVVGHQGQNFSAGANLALIIQLCEQKDWQGIEAISRTFQNAAQRLKYANFPVVSAPFHLCLGGGYEAAAFANRIVASAELYCGLVEVGVGIIPGAGGNLRVLLNNIQSMEKARTGPFPIVQKAFETIGFAKVSSSAKEAMKLGYLPRDAQIVINPEHLIFEAKLAALEMSKHFAAPEPTELILPGEGGRLAIEGSLDDLFKAGKISEHDRLIGRKLANVLTGGQKASPTHPVDEQYILDLEREAFVSLCGEKLSVDRMKYMLKNGKPLRN